MLILNALIYFWRIYFSAFDLSFINNHDLILIFYFWYLYMIFILFLALCLFIKFYLSKIIMILIQDKDPGNYAENSKNYDF